MSKETVLRFKKADAKLLEKKRVYDGFFKMDEYLLSHRLFAGGESEAFTREVFERGDAVVVIPYDVARQQVVLIEQFRAGALTRCETPWMLEFVAGMFEENESATEVGARECKEEANIDVKPIELKKVMTYLSSPGGMSETMHLYWADVDASGVEGVHGLDEENEDILVHVVSIDDALRLLNEGKITNASTVIGLQWLALNYKTLSADK